MKTVKTPAVPAPREVTQFSMSDLDTFRSLTSMNPNFQPTTPREMAMVTFLASPANDHAFAAVGGIGNVQRVRVLQHIAGQLTFDLVPKLPLHILEQRREEERRQAILAKVEALRADPKAFREFLVAEAYAILGRAAVALLLASVKQSRPEKKKAQVRNRVERKPKSDFEKAQDQDRKNRVETSKRAAAEFHAKKQGAV